MICCSLPLSLAKAAACQMVTEEVRMDSMMAVQKCTIIIFGRLDFFNCRRKYSEVVGQTTLDECDRNI